MSLYCNGSMSIAKDKLKNMKMKIYNNFVMNNCRQFNTLSVRKEKPDRNAKNKIQINIFLYKKLCLILQEIK